MKCLHRVKIKPKCCEKWEARLNTDIDWSRNFKKMQNIQEIKLKWFQIRLVHRILATSIVLMHMGIENDINCCFCRRERDSINYIFLRCVYVVFLGTVPDYTSYRELKCEDSNA